MRQSIIFILFSILAGMALCVEQPNSVEERITRRVGILIYKASIKFDGRQWVFLCFHYPANLESEDPPGTSAEREEYDQKRRSRLDWWLKISQRSYLVKDNELVEARNAVEKFIKWDEIAKQNRAMAFEKEFRQARTIYKYTFRWDGEKSSWLETGMNAVDMGLCLELLAKADMLRIRLHDKKAAQKEADHLFE